MYLKINWREMKAYEFKAYVQNNQMTIPKDYGEILNNKSVRVIILEKESLAEEPEIAPSKNISKKSSKNKLTSEHGKVRKRAKDTDGQLKSMLDELNDY